MIALEAAALVLGLCVVALIFLLDRPDDADRVSPSWLRRHREGR